MPFTKLAPGFYPKVIWVVPSSVPIVLLLLRRFRSGYVTGVFYVFLFSSPHFWGLTPEPEPFPLAAGWLPGRTVERGLSPLHSTGPAEEGEKPPGSEQISLGRSAFSFQSSSLDVHTTFAPRLQIQVLKFWSWKCQNLTVKNLLLLCIYMGVS